MNIKESWKTLWSNDSDRKFNRNSIETDSDDILYKNKGYYRYADNLRKYKANGLTKNVINAVPDDATRNWLELKVKVGEGADEKLNNQAAELINNRAEELGLQAKTRDLIKYSRIYDEGSLMYWVVEGKGNNIENSIDRSAPISDGYTIKKLNVVDDPAIFSINIFNTSNPTLVNYNEPNIMMAGSRIDKSRYSYLVDEFDGQSQTGISTVDQIEDGVDAHRVGLRGAKHILSRLGAVMFESPENALDKNTAFSIQELISIMNSQVTSDGIMAMLPQEKLTMLNFTFSGVKDVFDFVMDSVAGLSEVPKMRFMGQKGGGIVTGDGSEAELLNYYAKVTSYQENKLKGTVLTPVYDLIIGESDSELKTLIGDKPITYDIEFNPLYELTGKSKSEIRQIDSKSDEIDFKIGKSTGEELRQLDPRYTDLMPIDKSGEEDEDEDEDDSEDEEKTE